MEVRRLIPSLYHSNRQIINISNIKTLPSTEEGQTQPSPSPYLSHEPCNLLAVFPNALVTIGGVTAHAARGAQARALPKGIQLLPLQFREGLCYYCHGVVDQRRLCLRVERKGGF